MRRNRPVQKIIAWAALLTLAGCATARTFRNDSMDFGAIQTVAVLPLANLSRDTGAGERVRDVLITMLLATGAFYVLPSGQVAQGLAKVAVANPTAPSADDIVALCKILKADTVITGVIREYGDVRSGSATANMISASLAMAEASAGKVVWSASSTQGGIGWSERLFGGGGAPMNVVTEKAVDDLIKKLFE